MNEKSIRILYLDVDGVLITWRSHFAFSAKPEDNRFSAGTWGHYDPITAAFLAKFCTVYNIKIVVSSTWRVNEKNCFELLEKCNLKQFLHEDWRTIQSGEKRVFQIQEWLDRHPEVEDYLIIDDDIDKEMKNFIKCSMWNGLSGESMNTMIEWGRKEKQLIV